MYSAKVNWYDRYTEDTEEDRVDYVIVVAGSWGEAAEQINKQFEYINSIEMRQIRSVESKVVFMADEHMMEEVAELNME